MAEDPTSTGDIRTSRDLLTCDIYQPINVIGNNNQILLAPSDDNKSPEISRIHHDVQDPIESFTGREDILAEISDIIEKNRIQGKMTVLSQTNVVTGLGGIGKTETIRKYIYNCKSSYRHILWINAETFTEAKNSFSRIAHKLKMRPEEFEKGIDPLRDAVQEIYERLCKKRTLVIFDNAEKLGTAPAEEGIFAFLPKSIQPGWEKPTIIATSRIRKWKNVSVIELDGFHVEETYKLLLTQLLFDDTEENRGFGSQIALHTQGLPLAIQVVIGIIRRESDKRDAMGETPYTMQDFLAEFKKCDQDFIEQEPYDPPIQHSILKIFNISFQKLVKETQGTLAMKILTIMSFLSPDNIPKSLLQILLLPEKEGPSLPNALLLLHSFNLVTIKSTYFQVHRLIQRVVLRGCFAHPTAISSTEQSRRTSCLSQEDLVQSVVQDLREITIPSTKDQINRILQFTIQRFQNILEAMEPQSNIIYETLENGFQLAKHTDKPNPITFKFNQLLAKKLEYNGRYTDAITILEKLIDFPGGTLLKDLARLLNKNGKYAKSEELYKIIIKEEESQNGNKEANTLSANHDLASVFANQGKYAEAFKLYQHVLEAREKHLVPNHPDTLTTKHSLASVFKNQGKYDEAVKLFIYVLEARETNLEENHPDTMTTKHELACVFDYQGKHDESMKLFRNVLEGRENILGKNHPDTLITKHNLASVLNNQGKYEEASKLFISVLEARENILGPNHPDTLATKHKLAGVFKNQGNYAKALELYQYILGARANILGPNHPETLTTKHKLASVLDNQGKYEEAVELFASVLGAREKTLAQNDPKILTTKHKLASVFQNQGKYDEAVIIYENVMDARANILGQDHPDTLNTKHKLASAYDDQGKYDEAEVLFHYVLEARESILGPNHPKTLATKHKLASVFDNQGKYDEALDLDHHVLDSRANILGGNHPKTLSTKHKLANVFKNQGKYAHAVDLYQYVLKSRENILGQNHPKTLTTKRKLASALKKQRKYGDPIKALHG